MTTSKVPERAVGKDRGRGARLVAATLLCAAALSTVTALAPRGRPLAGASTTTTTTTSTSSAGCGATNPGSTTLHPSVEGVQRTVLVHYPNKAADTPRALVLNLHGSGSTAVDQDLFSGMDATANEDGFIVAYPQGDIPEGTGYDWNVPNEPLVGGASVPASAPDDVTFLADLVGLLERDYCVNPTEVYATGFSGGARMASQLACDESTLFAAIAPVSGLRRPTPCPTKRAVPVIAFHGSADAVDPFNGHGEAYWTYSVPTAAKDWAKQDHCAAKPATSEPSAAVHLTRYQDCAQGASVELYELTGEGHEWPGGPTMPTTITDELGPQSDAINANQVMWEFFVAHPL